MSRLRYRSDRVDSFDAWLIELASPRPRLLQSGRYQSGLVFLDWTIDRCRGLVLEK